jgi:UPF0271 protein
LLDEPARVAVRIRDWQTTGYLEVGSGKSWLVEAETVGVHADSPGSVEMARVVRTVLDEGGVERGDEG